MLILFSEVNTLLEVTGGRYTGAYFHGSPAVKGSAVWFQALTGVPRTIVCLLGDINVLRHELTHWMTAMLFFPSYDMAWIPQLIVEGLAEYTIEALSGTAGTENSVARQPSVIAWASENSFEDPDVELDPYSIGVSVVTYLIEQQGPRGLIESLSEWVARPDEMLVEIEAGWHAYLGVTAQVSNGEQHEWITGSVQLIP